MSLRAFHLFFIALSVVLAAFFAAWALGQYRAAEQPGYVVVAIASAGTAVALGFYAAAFQRKTRRL